MSHPNPLHDPDNVLPEDNKDCVCSVCEGEGKVEVMTSFRDDSGAIQLEGTGKFVDCPECQ